MRLTFKEISRKDKDYKSLKELYIKAFPKAERMPFWYMARQARRDDIALLGIYDEDRLIGMTYIMVWRDIVYIQYLAVAKNQRGKGYGSRILSDLKERYKDCRFVLEIEEVIKEAPNYKDRQKRQEFYEKNGFYEPGYLLTEGIRYWFMVVGEFNADEYLSMIRDFRGRLLSLISMPRIEKRK